MDTSVSPLEYTHGCPEYSPSVIGHERSNVITFKRLNVDTSVSPLEYTHRRREYSHLAAITQNVRYRISDVYTTEDQPCSALDLVGGGEPPNRQADCGASQIRVDAHRIENV